MGFVNGVKVGGFRLMGSGAEDNGFKRFSGFKGMVRRKIKSAADFLIGCMRIRCSHKMGNPLNLQNP